MLCIVDSEYVLELQLYMRKTLFLGMINRYFFQCCTHGVRNNPIGEVAVGILFPLIGIWVLDCWPRFITCVDFLIAVIYLKWLDMPWSGFLTRDNQGKSWVDLCKTDWRIHLCKYFCYEGIYVMSKILSHSPLHSIVSSLTRIERA